MLQLNELRSLIASAKGGENLEVFCEGRFLRELKEENPNLTWKQLNLGHFILIVPEPSMKSGKTLLFESLDKYDSGLVKLEMSENNARVYVSQYNRSANTKFKVTMKDGYPHVYADVADKKYIRMSDYVNARDKAIEELNRLRTMVRPDEYFEMISSDYDNGIPNVTAEDLEPEFKRRGVIYICDDCGQVVPEEQGEVDVCESCQSLRDGNEDQVAPPTSFEGVEQEAVNENMTPLQEYQCMECGEDVLLYPHEMKLCDMCRGID